MNNEELKKKIVEILDNNIRWQPYYYYISRGIVYEDDLKNIADALIAAGIGDVKEAEHRAEVAERALRIVAKEIPCDEWCPFSQKCNVELNGENGYQCCFDEYLRQAEKELAEERKDEN